MRPGNGRGEAGLAGDLRLLMAVIAGRAVGSGLPKGRGETLLGCHVKARRTMALVVLTFLTGTARAVNYSARRAGRALGPLAVVIRRLLLLRVGGDVLGRAGLTWLLLADLGRSTSSLLAGLRRHVGRCACRKDRPRRGTTGARSDVCDNAREHLKKHFWWPRLQCDTGLSHF